MKRFLAATLLALGAGLAQGFVSAPAALAATFIPPGMEWRTITTAHFRVHFPAELRDIARKAARYGEEAHEYLGPYFGRPDDVTDMTILDTEDSTNGFALPFPGSSLTFYVTPPSPEEEWYLGRYDNWLKMIVVHEYTHVLHLRSAAGPGGVPGFLNSALIRAFLPEFSSLINLDFLPDFMKEGLAVYWESALTGGGRAVEGQFDMVLRTQFSNGEPFGIDQASGKYQLDWAPGGVNYSYGTLFFKYLAAEYGSTAAAKLTDSLGFFPWTGINLASARGLGASTYDIWDDTISYFKDRYSRQITEIKKQPLTQAQSVTTDGRIHRHPRWLGNARLLYSRSPLEGTAGLLSTFLDGTGEDFVLSKSSRKDYSLTADQSSLYYYAGGDGPPLTSFYDVYRFDMKTRGNEQITHGLRAMCPAVAPDGSRLLVVLNGGGRNDLGMIDRYGKLLWRFRGPDFGNFSNPVWSPDGKQIALSQWVDGRTNVMIFDPEAKTLKAVAPEDSVQLFPAWSPDGKHLLFSSDRTGVTNLYAVRLADGKFFRLSNVVGGAFDPAVSPDQTKLAFSEYEAGGFNVKWLPYEPEKWAEVPGLGRLGAVPDVRVAAAGLSDAPAGKPAPESFPLVLRDASASEAPDVLKVDAAPEVAYNPLLSMVPKYVWPRIILDLDNLNALGPGLPEIPGVVGHRFGSGPSLYLLAYSEDVLQQHSVFGLAGYHLGFNRPAYALSYANDQLPPTLRAGFSVDSIPFFRPIPPEQLNISPSYPYRIMLGRESRTLSFGIDYPPATSPLVDSWIGGAIGHLGLSIENRTPFFSLEGNNIPTPMLAIGTTADGTPVALARQINSVSVSVSRSDTERPVRPISPSGGSLWTAGVSRSDPLMGSDIGTWKAWSEGRYFIKTIGRQILALRGVAGVNFTDPQASPRDGAYFVQVPITWDSNFFTLGERIAPVGDISVGKSDGVAIHSLSDLRTIGEVGSFLPLRGFPVGVEVGSHVALGSAEYRIPILEIERGIGTVPIFFDRISFAPFADMGKAWDVWSAEPLLFSAGAEFRIHMTLAQGIPSEARIGYARGLGPGGVNQLILGIGSVF